MWNRKIPQIFYDNFFFFGGVGVPLPSTPGGGGGGEEAHYYYY